MALHFELVTPERLVRSDEVYMVVVPGSEGEEGVLEGHAPKYATSCTLCATSCTVQVCFAPLPTMTVLLSESPHG